MAALACLLLIPATASARYDPLGSGSTRLTLDKGLLTLLGRHGVELSAVAPATLAGRVVTFPVAAGKFDPTSARGVVDHEGALLFSAGARSVPLKDLQLKTTQRRSPFSVKVGGGQLKLATAASLRVSRAGFGEKIAVRKLALSAKVATRLAKKLRLRGVLREAVPLGSTLTRAQPETVSLLGQGVASLSLDSAIAAKLQGLFVAINPIFPAEHIGPVFNLPIFGGTISPDASLGTLETSGALEALQLGGGQIFWQETWLDFATRTASAEVNVQPSPPYAGQAGRLPIGNFGPAAVASNPRARTVAVTAAAITLQAQTAATFNEIFARPQGKDGVFQAGEALGTISFTAHTQ